MKTFRFILSILLTILSCFFIIKCSNGTVIFTLLIFLLMSIPFYLLYKDKRKNKLYTIIVSTIILLLTIYIISNSVDITSSTCYHLGIDTTEEAINYSYTKVNISFNILFIFLYFISLFLNLFITFDNFIKEKSNNKIDILTSIIFLLNIIIYLNAYFSPKLPEITNYSNIYYNADYVSQFYGLFAVLFICIIFYTKINSRD